MATTEFHIRPYQTADREALRHIAADTAFFGEPIEALMEDRSLFLDFFYRYYTDLEPEHAWIACAGDEAAGFLTGCTDTQRQQRELRSRILPGLFLGLATGRYRLGPLGRQYAAGAIKAALRGEHVDPDLDAYPAHLHINVAKAWRGCGLGRGLMSAYLNQLRELGLPGVHLGTTDRNVTACKMYERFGFRLLGTQKSDLWRFVTGEQVEMRSYGMRL